MRELRLLHPTDDGQHLVVETADGLEQFRLPNDAALRAAARSPMAAPAAPAPAPVVDRAPLPIGPREIQVRVRAGESAEDLAEAYGVALERILRFAAPVLEERVRITEEARRARARRTGREGTEPAVVVFGEAVDARYTAHGIFPSEVSWDSRRREDGEWVVIARWTGAGSTHAAEWLFHRASRSVTPLDDTAGDLLSDRPIRPVVPPVPQPERPSLAAAPPLLPGVVAFPPMPDAHTGPLPRVEDVFDQDAAADGPRDLPPYVPAPSPAASAAVLPPEPELDLPLDLGEDDTPALPLGIALPERPAGVAGLSTLRNLSADKREESDEDRAARARVPSWDDILLGVRRKQD